MEHEQQILAQGEGKAGGKAGGTAEALVGGAADDDDGFQDIVTNHAAPAMDLLADDADAADKPEVDVEAMRRQWPRLARAGLAAGVPRWPQVPLCKPPLLHGRVRARPPRR